MPIYLYVHEVTGERLEVLKKMEERDDAPPGYRRQFVAPIALSGMAADPNREETATMRTLAGMEERLGLRELERQTGYSAATLRETWREDHAPRWEVKAELATQEA